MSRFKTSSSDRVNFPVILAGGAILAILVFLILSFAGGNGSGAHLQQMRDRMDQMESRIAMLEDRLADRSRQLDAMGDTLGFFSDNFDRFQALPEEMEQIQQKTEFLETRQANLEKRLSEEAGGAPSRTAASASGRTEVKSPRIEKKRPAGSASSESGGSAQAAAAPDRDASRHTVRDGETLYSIAQRYDVSVERILELNEMEKDDIIRPGQELLIRE